MDRVWAVEREIFHPAIVFDDFSLFSGRYETTENENGQVLLSFSLHKLFAVPGDLMQNFFALSRSHQSSCSFAAMEIALLVIAKLPRCISRPVVFERDRDFVATNDVSLSRRRVKLCVVVESFEDKRVGFRPARRRYGFLAHNRASNLWIAFFAGRLVERQINFRKRFA